MSNSLREQSEEFCSASLNSYSYNISQNVYIWFGLLWGLPIPIVTIIFEAILTDTTQITEILYLAVTTPVQWFFFAHPVLFGIIFGILGTVRQRKDNALNEKIKELKFISTTDPLTGLSNRRKFSQAYSDELARIDRKEESLSLLLLDLDYFKKINDTYGHKVGDEVLQATGKYLQTHSRPYDTTARWGGEEFIILLPHTSESEALDIAERIREDFSSGVNLETEVKITVSIGVSQYDEGDSLDTLTDRADKALYKAKDSGRNNSIASSALSPSV